MVKYHKVTHEEHLTILASRRSVCPVPYEKIADKLGISVRTVRRYAHKQPNSTQFKRIRTSIFDPYKDEIETLLNKEMGKQSHNIKTAMREFRAMHPGMRFGKTAFYDFVRHKCELKREPRLARIPIEHDYGEAQIDFCAVTYYRAGRRVNGHQFTMTFPKSDVSFVQLFPAENQQCLFEAMKSIFEYIGFVPKSILFDNASTAVSIIGGKGTQATPTKEYSDFAAWYGYEYIFCNPASGWEKGAVEHANATKRKDYFTPPPHIQDERQYNIELLERCHEDAKEHHHLKGIPKLELFENDKKSGIPLPDKPFECSRMELRKTDKCGLVSVKKCIYSVSDKHPSKWVMVKYGAFDVEIFEETGEFICHHRRSYQDGSTTIDSTMYADALAARPRARIKKSDNEYIDEPTNEILTDLNKAVTSMRPAARVEALDDFCEHHEISYLPIPIKTKEAAILYHLTPFNSDMERYDHAIQSNSLMVQKASPGSTVCRCSSKQKEQRTGLFTKSD